MNLVLIWSYPNIILQRFLSDIGETKMFWLKGICFGSGCPRIRGCVGGISGNRSSYSNCYEGYPQWTFEMNPAISIAGQLFHLSNDDLKEIIK